MSPIKAPRIDWRAILDDLRDKGCSGYRVALRLEKSWSTVQGWRDCKEDIGHGNGCALLKLHAEYCGAGLTFRRIEEGEASSLPCRSC